MDEFEDLIHGLFESGLDIEGLDVGYFGKVGIFSTSSNNLVELECHWVLLIFQAEKSIDSIIEIDTVRVFILLTILIIQV